MNLVAWKRRGNLFSGVTLLARPYDMRRARLLASEFLHNRQQILCRRDVEADRQVSLGRDWDIVTPGQLFFVRRFADIARTLFPNIIRS